jgi:cell wall-associated NlpC family hydrolase/predicted esterase
MKTSPLIFTLLFSFSAQAFSEDLRKFTSADGTKTFDGVLTRYDAASGTVEVKRTGLGPLKFPLTMLSAADQDYVKEQSKPRTAAAIKEPAVDFDFEHRDSLPQTDTPKSQWDTEWGPAAKDYPELKIPDGVKDPVAFQRQRIVAAAKKYIDLPYLHKHIPAAGGLDCSNFTAWVYNYSMGIRFPSGIANQAENAGRRLEPNEKLQPGDLLFQTNVEGSAVAHSVIYLGDDKLIDADKGKIAIRDFANWYKARFSHARRIIEDSDATPAKAPSAEKSASPSKKEFTPKATAGGKNRMEVRSVSKDLAKRLEALNPKYLAAFPPDFTQAKPGTIPLVIYLHGSAGRGDDPMSCIDMPFNQIVGTHRDFPAVAVSPQLRSVPLAGETKPRMSWHIEDLDHLLTDILKEFPQIDQDRVYLTGFSMGGYGTWDWAAASRKHFAAIIPISGGANTAEPRSPKNFGNLPIWAFHGDADTTVNPQNTIKLVESIKAARGDAQLTLLPGATHQCSDQVYLNPEVYRWLFSKKRL